MNTEIGSFCSIANNVKIGGGKHPIDWASTSPVFYKGRDSVTKKFSIFERDQVMITKIEHDVWIGEGCIIKQGVIIGVGSVIGMGSVVTKDVEPYSIVGGVPAKHIKYRFSKEIITKLIQSEWWLLDDEKLNQAAV
ncbi:MAG: CatB-related O-acetyltransferase, partial [Vulcanococcus sp.]